MKNPSVTFLIAVLAFLFGFQRVAYADVIEAPSRFLSHIVDPSKTELAFYWQDKNKQPYRSFQNLKQALIEQNKKLLFAMNGGVFQEDLRPLGLYIEQGQQKYRLNKRKNAYGNFYIQPNGVFYLTKSGQGHIVETTKFKAEPSIHYATQSGPLLVVDGRVNSKLIEGSSNLRIRNGVGVLPDGKLLFAISKSFVNFYDFATFFKQHGCRQALYLDGSVSRIYLPDNKRYYSDGVFGVIIAETVSDKN